MEMDKTTAWQNREEDYHALVKCQACSQNGIMLFENYCCICGQKIEWFVTDDSNLPYWA